MNVPKLRFVEFSGEWEHLPAEQLFENIAEKNCSAEKVLTIIQGTGTVLRENSGRDILFDKTTTDNYKKVQKGDFIIHLRSFQAGLEIANSNGIVSPAYTILRSKKAIGTMFYRNYFRSDRFINQTLCSAVEGVRDGRQISYSRFKQIPIVSTTLPEQQKIAEFLSAIDEKINNQESIVASLETQKKCFMQQIFSRELRFKNENSSDFPEWKEIFLGEVISKILSGTSVNSEDVSVKKDEIGVLKTSCVYNNTFNLLQNKKVLEEEKTRVSCPVEKGTLIVSRMNTPDLVGACGFVFEDNFNIFLPDRLWKINFYNQVCSQFIYFLLISPNYRTIVTAKATGTSNSMKNISQNDFRALVVTLPSLPEQQKIADFLSTYDKKIDAEKQILTHWKTIKKALLQQMFV